MLNSTPLNHEECRGDMSCIKPQYIYHIGVPGSAPNWAPLEIGTEMTIPVNMVNDEYLEYKKTHVVDIINLLKNSYASYTQWDPTRAIKDEIQLDVLKKS
jgi:hypothetical protein